MTVGPSGTPSMGDDSRLLRLEAVAAAAERYLAATNTLALRPSKDVEAATAEAHRALTEALVVLGAWDVVRRAD